VDRRLDSVLASSSCWEARAGCVGRGVLELGVVVWGVLLLVVVEEGFIPPFALMDVLEVVLPPTPLLASAPGPPFDLESTVVVVVVVPTTPSEFVDEWTILLTPKYSSCDTNIPRLILLDNSDTPLAWMRADAIKMGCIRGPMSSSSFDFFVFVFVSSSFDSCLTFDVSESARMSSCLATDRLKNTAFSRDDFGGR